MKTTTYQTNPTNLRSTNTKNERNVNQMTTQTKKFVEVSPGDMFRIPHGENDLSNYYSKVDATTMLDIEDNTVLDLGDEIFSGIVDDIEVETIDFDSIFNEKSGVDFVDLTENEYFPDYELVVSYGDDVMVEFDIHCWGDKRPDDATTVWFDGTAVLEGPRSYVESIFARPLEEILEVLGVNA